MSEQAYSIALLHNAREVVWAERLLNAIRLEITIVPVPEHFSSECGMAIRVLSSDVLRLRYELEKAGLNPRIVNPV